MAQSVAEVIAGDTYTTTPAYEYPDGLGQGDYPHFILFTARRAYTSTVSQGTGTGASSTATRGTPTGSVALYMPPDALKTSYTQTYGDVDMGASIGIAMSSQDYAAAGEGLLGADISGALDVAKGVGLSSIKDSAIKMVADKLKAGVTASAGDVAQAIERASGRIMNPHKAVIYQGPGGFRTFSYTFSMVAKSSSEARTINNIVRFFKEHMHPGVGGGGGINNLSSHTLTYPDEFSIRYTVNYNKSPADDNYRSMFRIHNCFLESFSADYTTSSLPVFIDDDGEPQTTTISMSFKETQLLTKDDIKAGF